MFQFGACIFGFKHLKALYKGDEYLGEIYKACQIHLKEDFLLHDGYVFKGAQLCVPKCGTRELLIKEVHKGSPVGHYREKKTLLVVKEHYYWPSISKDVQDILKR